MEDKEITSKILEITRNLLDLIGFEAEIKMGENEYGKSLPVVCISSEKDLSILIGKNGQNLSALEHLIKLLTYKRISGNTDIEKLSFMVDINDYRKSRVKYILNIAQEAAQRVISTQKPEALLPMSPFERRLIHTELAAFKDVQTESIGEEPRRRVVVKPLILD